MSSEDVAPAVAGSVAEVRRWKTIALVSAFVAVAIVAGVSGWSLRGARSAAVPSVPVFTGGGIVIANNCDPIIAGGFTIEQAQILVVDAVGKDLASGRLMGVKSVSERGCVRPFVIDRIPGGRGIYTLQVGRWKQNVTEAALRGNLAELSIS